MARLLLRPGWVVTHLAVVAIAVLFVALGMWQLDRHAERQAEAVRIDALAAAPPVPLEELLGVPDPFLRLVTVTGTYLAEEELQLSPRSRNELPGYEVLTPMALPDGRTLVVDRGWVPLGEDAPPPPAGEVTLTARLRAPARARQVLPVDGGPRDGGPAALVSAVDLDVLAPQLVDPVRVAWAEVVDEAARLAGALPRPAEPPAPEGTTSSLSYAIQWFAFAVIGAVGYPLLLRRRIADRREPGPDQPVASDAPRPTAAAAPHP